MSKDHVFIISLCPGFLAMCEIMCSQALPQKTEVHLHKNNFFLHFCSICSCMKKRLSNDLDMGYLQIINIYFPLDLPNSMFYWCKQENRYVRSLRHCWLDAGWEAGKRQAGCCSYNYLRRSVFHSKPAIITSHQDRNTSSVSSQHLRWRNS